MRGRKRSVSNSKTQWFPGLDWAIIKLLLVYGNMGNNDPFVLYVKYPAITLPIVIVLASAGLAIIETVVQSKITS